jgi:hypothetical protein
VTSWWETPRGEERLGRDRALLSQRHPGLVISVVDSRVEVNGPINIVVGDSEICLRHQIRLVLPGDYPESAPDAYDSANAFPHIAERHFHLSGKCCLWVDVNPKWSSLDSIGLVRFIDEQVAVFFLRQWLFDEGQGWTGPQHSHGLVAYIEYAAEKGLNPKQLLEFLPALRGWDEGHQPCPCGSGNRYWLCHREFVVSFRKADPDEMTTFLAVLEGQVEKRGAAHIRHRSPRRSIGRSGRGMQPILGRTR